MKCLEIKIKSIGNQLQSFSESLLIAKAIKENINVEFNGFSIRVSPDSNINDLMEIHKLKSMQCKDNQ